MEIPLFNGRFWHLGVELMFEAFGRRLWVCSNPKLNIYVKNYHYIPFENNTLRPFARRLQLLCFYEPNRVLCCFVLVRKKVS